MRERWRVFEASFEVANKVGGIHTVLASKAAHMKARFRDYFAVGPFFERKAALAFENELPSPEFGAVFERLRREHGMRCYSGHWLVPGRPKCVLVDPGALAEEAQANALKGRLWEQFGIDSLHAPADFTFPVAWAHAAGRVIEALACEVFGDKPCLAHFHEWLAGAGLLYLASAQSALPTVFTTHATVLGRALSERGEALFEEVEQGLSEGRVMDRGRAAALGVQAKHLTEQACARHADCFTTVSEVTAREAAYVLGRAPDAVLPNGLDVEKFGVMEELANRHVQHRNRIRAFVSQYFTPYYPFDAQRSLFFFLSGRHEVHNKGIDLFIDALGALNARLKKEAGGGQEGSKAGAALQKTVVAFLFVPGQHRGAQVELLKHLALYDRIEHEIEEEVQAVRERLLERAARGQLPRSDRLLSRDFCRRLKHLLFELRHHAHEHPPLCALEVEHDEVLSLLHKAGLFNRRTDPVKVIYYPQYLSAADGLLGLPYRSVVEGCHLGVFPSYYEPWGYTPVETMAAGVPAVTSDLAGFGRFMLAESRRRGVDLDGALFVVPRERVAYPVSRDALAGHLYAIYAMEKQRRGEAKMLAKKLSYWSAWSSLLGNYVEAYRGAAVRARRRAGREA